MYMKRFLLIYSFAVTLLGASAVSAQAPSTTNQHNNPQQKHCAVHKGAVLSAEQRTELQQIKKAMRTQLAPLIKEKRALRLQILGKMATPNAQWNEIASLVEKNNANNGKIATLIAKTRFETYQKLGVLMPLGRAHHGHHACHMAAR